jgi:hypothetical protein
MMKERRFKTRMVEYCKKILHHFTFNPALFRKEYKKSLQYLNAEDQAELKHWVRNNIKQV